MRWSLELACVEAVFFESQFATLIEEVSIGTGPDRYLTPLQIVHGTLACWSHKAEHVIRAVQIMDFQPFLEEVGNLK